MMMMMGKYRPAKNRGNAGAFKEMQSAAVDFNLASERQERSKHVE
jgi:hypothetical protein